MLALVPITTPSLNFVGDVAHSLLRDGTSAFAASALATTLLHPLDTLKSRLQSDAYAVRPSTVELPEPPAVATSDAAKAAFKDVANAGSESSSPKRGAARGDAPRGVKRRVASWLSDAVCDAPQRQRSTAIRSTPFIAFDDKVSSQTCARYR